MFNTMEKLGLGPKFIRLDKAMYSGDSIVNEQHGEKTRPLYLGRGLRQVSSFLYVKHTHAKQGAAIQTPL